MVATLRRGISLGFAVVTAFEVVTLNSMLPCSSAGIELRFGQGACSLVPGIDYPVHAARTFPKRLRL